MADDRGTLLLAYARRRDHAALERLVAGLHGPAYGFALRALGDPAAAEDAAQEVLVALVRAAARFDPGRDFGAW